jgi:hypothetical protein
MINEDRLYITLRLGQHVNNFPDPAVNIDASFALDVAPDPGHHGLGAVSPFPRHRHVATREQIKTEVSFPFWAYAIGFIGLAIAVDMAEDKAHRQAQSMIDQIVDLLNGWFRVPAVHGLDKHDAGFYVNPSREQLFWVTFCPPLEPVIGPG